MLKFLGTDFEALRIYNLRNLEYLSDLSFEWELDKIFLYQKDVIDIIVRGERYGIILKDGEWKKINELIKNRSIPEEDIINYM